jgi:hypothetical protein
MIKSAIDFLDSWNAILNLSTPDHHKKIMRFLVETYSGEPRRALLAAFRHSGKSTIVGIFAAWVLSIRPEARIMVLSAENALASRMVGHIRNIMENHPACADMLPAVKKEWSATKLTIRRPIGIREPSVICQGVHGNITGLRSDMIICDDVEVPNTAGTAAKREGLRERLRELDFILSPGGCIIYIGTPHAADTIYKVNS